MAGMAQTFAYEQKGNSAVIWRCFSRDTKAVIPERIDGLPVREIGPYAFSAHMDEGGLYRRMRAGQIRLSASLLLTDAENSALSEADGEAVAGLAGRLPSLQGGQVEEIQLPDSVLRVGRYCFYNCSQLERLSFTGALLDWGSGVFTGCHRIKEVCVRTAPGEGALLQDMLEEVREELCVLWEEGENDGKRTAKLMFPEFYEEGVENTPARILETHVHGSGLLYRNSFRDRRPDFRQYDLLFPYAQAQESEEFLIRLTLGRLRYPEGLCAKAQEQYMACLTDRLEAFVCYLVETRDLETLRWVEARLDGAGRTQFLELLAGKAGKAQYTEALSYAMERMHASQTTSVRRRRLEL